MKCNAPLTITMLMKCQHRLCSQLAGYEGGILYDNNIIPKIDIC